MLQAEIKGKSADHYRAYGAVKLLRRPTIEEQIEIANKSGAPLPRGSKMRYTGEDVIAEGQVTTGAVAISAPKGKEITRVVFFQGYGDEEKVVGSVDVNAGGKVDIEFVEPPAGADGEPMIVDIAGTSGR